MEQDLRLTLATLPESWIYCFLSQCPKAGQCVRFQSGEVVNNERKHGRAVFPTALDGDGCQFFKPIRKLRMAWGFAGLFGRVRHEDYKQLRQAVYEIVGGRRNFYRYDKGEKMLAPEQQRAVLALFDRYGYKDSMSFDNYKDTFDLE